MGYSMNLLKIEKVDNIVAVISIIYEAHPILFYTRDMFQKLPYKINILRPYKNWR